MITARRIVQGNSTQRDQRKRIHYCDGLPKFSQAQWFAVGVFRFRREYWTKDTEIGAASLRFTSLFK